MNDNAYSSRICQKFLGFHYIINSNFKRIPLADLCFSKPYVYHLVPIQRKVSESTYSTFSRKITI